MVGRLESSVEPAKQFGRTPGALPRLRGRGEQGRFVTCDLPLSALSGSDLLRHSEGLASEAALHRCRLTTALSTVAGSRAHLPPGRNRRPGKLARPDLC